MRDGVQNLIAILTQAMNHSGLPNEQRREQYSIESFMRQRPPSFSGSSDPLVAEQWISTTEKIFSVLQCSEHDKVILAVYPLEDDADQWWNLIKNTRPRDEIESMEWDEFKNLFLSKYFPRILRKKMEKEFFELKQKDDESVGIYEANFTRLARYASGIIIQPESKVDRFFSGLKPSLRRALAIRDFSSYEEIVRCAIKEWKLMLHIHLMVLTRNERWSSRRNLRIMVKRR